jgi:class 3 adenylate cyclase/pimeloyl-ACP methyl ester carboxylesterase
MEPEIRYCTTEDGVSIAYCQGGEGTPFISVSSLQASNIELEWREWEWYRIMAARRRLIRFDNRGTGSSQRDVPGFSLEELTLDIGAVADALSLDRFVLYGEVWSVPMTVAYAAKHPERVSHLILFGGFARWEELFEIPRVKTLFSMLDQGDWELFTDTMSLAQVGWQLTEVARGAAASWRASTTLEQAQAFYRAARQYDVTSLLPLVKAPTLVMHPRGAAFPTLDQARKLAAGIPGARFKVLESETLWSDEMEPQFLDALDEFIGDGGRPGAAEVQPQARRVVRRSPGLVTVLFTDLVGHTEMMSRLGDDRGREVLREHERITRETLEANGGTEVKTMGDGFMASFGSVTKAVECAIALQRAFAEHGPVGAPLGDGDDAGGAAPNDAAVQKAIDERNRDVGQGAASSAPTEPLSVRVGLNAGEPIEEDGDLFGATVILASRIAAKAEGGEILVADTVRGLCSGKGFLFADRGEFVAKGFEEPVRVYEVRWRDG